MSVYQWIEFRAVDAPLDDAALEFMHEQSTRAAIDRWSFTNEYHFGDFRGDSIEMMRRGYDVHVHYANFGVRRIYLRLPDGFLHAERLAPFLLDSEIDWDPDDNGTGGILSIDPEGDAGTWDWMEDVQSLATDLVPLREMIIAGDFRPLYIAHIALNYDDEALEPPIPAGLQEEHYALDRFCSFYEVDPDLVSVAAEGSSELEPAESDDALIRMWLSRRSKAELAEHLENCLKEPYRNTSQLLRSVRADLGTGALPESGTRTIGCLRRRAAEIDDERQRQREAEAAQEAERRRLESERALQAKLAEITGNPEKAIMRIDAAIEERTRPAYRRAAEELSMLAKACGRPMASAKADAIRTKYPTRNALSSELKKAGF
jgi:hypothetical protein